MTVQQWFTANPGYAAEFEKYRVSRGGQADPEQWVRNIAASDPSNPVFQTLDQAAISGADANTRRAQQGTQQGAFESTGGSTQTQTQGQTQTGTQNVLDTLGFGELLKGQVGGAQAADTARTGFLTDLVATGGAGFNSQVEQAANRALSGPGMIGTGNAAKGRVAGSAVADVARNNAGLRLQAADQLRGPTAVQSLVAAGNPFLGQTTSQESIGTQELVSNESQRGTASSSTQQSGFGTEPSGGGGGCYVSSTFALKGQIGKRVIRHCVKFKLSQRRFRYMLWGYSLYGHFLARQVERFDGSGKFLLPICRAILYQELRWSGRKLPFKFGPWLYHSIFHHGSALIGLCSRRRKVITVISDLSERMKEANLFFGETFK